MNILLLQSGMNMRPHCSLDDSYPIGLGYIHASLKAAGHSVRTLVNANCSLFEECQRVEEAIAECRPDLIGFQLLTANRARTLEVIELVGRLAPGAQVVVGGAHATACWRTILVDHPDLLVLRGEADQSIVQLTDALARGGDFSTVEGLAWVAGGEVVANPMPTGVDVAALPYPEHGAFLDSSSESMSVLTSRGCPFECSFCAVARRRMRMRPVDSVLDEIERVVGEFRNIKLVKFFDDQMFFDNRRVIELCEGIVRRGIRTKFCAMARLKPCSSELVKALEAAGFIEVAFGLETGSVRVAKNVGKGIDQSDALRTFELFRSSPIRVFLFLIVGLEGESRETVDESARFVRMLYDIKYSPTIESIGIATVYPETDLFEKMQRAGRIDEQFWANASHVPLFTLEHSVGDLRGLYDALADQLDPGRLFVSLRAVESQEEYLLELSRYVAVNWYAPEGPRCNREYLRPYVGWLIESLRLLMREGGLAVPAAIGALRSWPEGGPARSELGGRDASSRDREWAAAREGKVGLVLTFFQLVAESSDERLKGRVRQALKDTLIWQLRRRSARGGACSVAIGA